MSVHQCAWCCWSIWRFSMGLLTNLLTWCYWCLGWRKIEKPRLTPAGNPLPETVHKVLELEDLGPGRLIIVGDVHGCYDTLLELLKRMQYKPRHDNLILVGDLVDKGPKSQQVVAAARAWCEGSYCWVVRGNHDDAALAAGMYVARGGNQNELKAKFNWVTELMPEDVEFLTELPFSLQVKGYNVLVVHAALVPGLPLEQQDLSVLTKVRDLLQTPDGSWVAFEEPQENSQPWAQCWEGPNHVFFGHDARRNLQTAPCATGLDTGCVYGRQLTACVLPPLSNVPTESSPDDDVTLQSGRNGRARGDSHPCSRQEGQGRLPVTPSLQELQGELHSVPSGFVLDKKAAKAEKKKAKLLKKQAAAH